MEMAVLRLCHIVAGVFWAGGATIGAWFVWPAAGAAGAAGQSVMQGIMQRRLPLYMNIAAWVALISGTRMYMLNFSPAWLGTVHGIVLTAGSVLALGAFFIGIMVSRPTAARMGAIGAAVAQSGKPPTPEQSAEMQALQAKLAKAGNLVAAHLAAAVVLMAAARLAASL